jgi:glycosyltransferase involved in cell wall biosynthesis
MSPAVSVVTACFNAERHLEETVQSVLGQSFSDLELILVDDGATDSTPAVIAAAAARDRRVVGVRSPKNEGPANARNRGLRVARGEWIAILDSDDVALPHRLATQIEYASRHPDLSLIGANAFLIDATNAPIGKSQWGEMRHDQIASRLRSMGSFFPHSSWLVRRSTMLQLGGYDTFFKKAQDYELLLRIIETARVACMPDTLIQLRKSENSLSHDSESLQYRFGLTALIGHLSRSGMLQVNGRDKQMTYDMISRWFVDNDLPRRMSAQRHFGFAWDALRTGRLFGAAGNLLRAFSFDPIFLVNRRSLKRLQANPLATLARYL